MCFDFLCGICWNILNIRRTQWVIIIMVSVFLVRLKWNLNFRGEFWRNTQISNFFNFISFTENIKCLHKKFVHSKWKWKKNVEYLLLHICISWQTQNLLSIGPCFCYFVPLPLVATNLKRFTTKERVYSVFGEDRHKT